MNTFKPGLVHIPVTPFKGDQSVDYAHYSRILDFHLRNGAEALALPMPQSEDISLTEPELRTLIEFAIKYVNGRVPVIAHISDPGTAIAVERARHAATAGASAIASHPPYFWHPRADMVTEHLVQIGCATRLPFFICTPVVEDAGTHLTAEIVLDVLNRLENLAGIVDASMRFVFMADVLSRAREIRPDFQLVAGTDFMVFNAVVGGNGVFSPLASVAPALTRQIYDLCKLQQFKQARRMQEDMAELHHVIKRGGHGGLKTALEAMGRGCGAPRLPSLGMDEPASEQLAARITAMSFLNAEPRGW